MIRNPICHALFATNSLYRERNTLHASGLAASAYEACDAAHNVRLSQWLPDDVAADVREKSVRHVNAAVLRFWRKTTTRAERARTVKRAKGLVSGAITAWRPFDGGDQRGFFR